MPDDPLAILLSTAMMVETFARQVGVFWVRAVN